MRYSALVALFVLSSIARSEEPTRGYLGIAVDESTTKLRVGALITRISFHSGAEEAGLMPGDVILSQDGSKIADGPDFIAQRARSKQLVGDTCKLQISRQGTEREVIVKIKKLGPERFLIQKDPPRVDGGTAISDMGGTHSEGGVTNGGNDIVFIKAGEGVITRVGDYEQLESGLHSVNITGYPKHAIQRFTGDVKLAGMLHCTLKDFTPKAGDAIELFADAKSLSGKFELLFLPPAPQGLKWEVVYDDLANKVDFDNDGKIDVTLVARPSTK